MTEAKADFKALLQRIAEGTYTPGEVDRQFSDTMNDDFENWKKEQAAK